VPELHIITGSNGAGKSTIGPDYLPDHISKHYTVFDGDKLFLEKRKELFPAKTKSHKEARNIATDWLEAHFVSLVENALEKKDHFVYEGHFSTEGPWQTPKRFKDNGYTLHLIFFGLEDTGLSELRVVERSKMGGHYVNPIEIDRNFHGNLIFLDQNFQWIDELLVVDTSSTQHHTLLHTLNGKVDDRVNRHQLPTWFISFMPKLANKFFPENLRTGAFN
jgi:predicted ABC-type ATPase